MALIAVGVVGLIYRVVTSGSDELVLSGILPISQEIVTKVTIRSEESETSLIRSGDSWRVGAQPVFPPRLGQFWAAVSEIDGAQLISVNEATQERIGVASGQGTVVSFFLGDFVQEEFTVGKWTSDVRLCYLRRSGKTEVHAIECPVPASTIFDADPDGWRNPVVSVIPRDQVEAVTFSYPDEQFILRIIEGQWVIDDGRGALPANPAQVDRLLSILEVLVASGFADDDEAEDLDFNLSDASLRVQTFEGAGAPTTRFRILKRDDVSYYLKTPAQDTTFIIEGALARELMKRTADFLSP